MAGEQRVVLDSKIFHLSRAKWTVDAKRRKFMANFGGIVANLPRIHQPVQNFTPRQFQQHHRRGIITPELRSSYHGTTTRMTSVFSSLTRKVDIKLLPQTRNRRDSTRATIDGKVPKGTRDTPLRLRIALRKSGNTVFSNYCPKGSLAKPVHGVNGYCKWCDGGMTERVGDVRCCSNVICRCFCQRCDLKSGRHCVTCTAPSPGHRKGPMTPRQQNISNVKQNFASDANIYFPFNGYKRQPRVHVPKGSRFNPSVKCPGDEPESQPENGEQEGYHEIQVTGTLGMLKLRALLPVVGEGEQVLFRSPDDGWYYAGTVSRDCGDFMYIITDGHGHQEQVWREDIVSDSDRTSQVTVGQKVIAQHPEFGYSYAPGEVLAKGNGKVKVKLYDGIKTDWTCDFAPLSKAKYDNDVTYLTKMREEWIGEPVLARFPSGEYKFGTVAKCVKRHQYKVTWTSTNGISNSSTVDVRHMFGSLTPYREIQTEGYLLALHDACYLPAKVTVKNKDTIGVTFVEGSVRYVEESDCFWISPSYYYDAVAVYFNARMRAGDGEDGGTREEG